MVKVSKGKLQEALKKVRDHFHNLVVAELQTTNSTYCQIAEKQGVSESTVYLLSRVNSIPRPAQLDTEPEHCKEAGYEQR
jgi:hypothetical protein